MHTQTNRDQQQEKIAQKVRPHVSVFDEAKKQPKIPKNKASHSNQSNLQRKESKQTFSNKAAQPLIQAKLKIGRPNDRYEQEADRIADMVMRMKKPDVQRKPTWPFDRNSSYRNNDKEEEMLQTKPFAEQINPLAPKQLESEAVIQTNTTGDVTPEVTPEISFAIQLLQGGGQPLSESERSFFEPRFGADFSNVRVHNDARAENAARSVNARAFTLGRNVVFGAREYSPGTLAGRKLLAHELTHVVQQSGQDLPILMKTCSCAGYSGPREDRRSGVDEHRAFFEHFFPRLVQGDYCVLEGSGSAVGLVQEQVIDPIHRNQHYICYGWAIGDTTGRITEQVIVERFGGREYQGENSIRMTDLHAFYSHHGFPLTGSWVAPDILIYGTGNIPKHAARKSSVQCEGLHMYTSKLGIDGPLIAHLPNQLEGGEYGNIIGGFSRHSEEYDQNRIAPIAPEDMPSPPIYLRYRRNERIRDLLRDLSGTIQPKLKEGQTNDKNEQGEVVLEHRVKGSQELSNNRKPFSINHDEAPINIQRELFLFNNLASNRTYGTQLDPTVRSNWEKLLSMPLGWIRVHASHGNRDALAVKGRVAETHNGTITVPEEAHPPKSTSALALLGHEVAHAVQQVSTKGIPNPPSQLENEADKTSKALMLGQSFYIKGMASSDNLALSLQIPPRIQLGTLFLCPERGSRLQISILSESERVPEGEIPGAFEGFAARDTAIRFASDVNRLICIVRDTGGQYHSYNTSLSPYSEEFACEITPVEGNNFTITSWVNQPLGTTLAPDETTESGLITYIRNLLSDNQLGPPKWDNIWRHATELNIDNHIELSHLLYSEDLNFESDSADLIAFLCCTNNPSIQRFVRSFTTNIIPGPPRELETDPVSIFLTQSIESQSLDVNEAAALRQFKDIMSFDYMNIVFEDANFNNVTLASFLLFLQISEQDFQSLASTSQFFPITLLENDDSARQNILQHFIHGGTREHNTFGIIRTLLRDLNLEAATSVLQRAGLRIAHARILAVEFTRSEREYQHHVESKPLLTLSFRQVGEQWELPPECYQNWSLPWHPGLIHSFTPAEGHTERRTFTPESVTSIANHRFASGEVINADRIVFSFRDRSIPLIIAEELVENDLSLLLRIENALGVLPVRHAALIQELAIDPGNDPEGPTLGEAFSENFTVNLYLRGAGPNVSQSELNRTTVHEVGHLVSYQAKNTDPSFWTQWEQAMENDSAGISRYGFKSRGEDFAETYVLFLAGGRDDQSTRQRYSHRFAILDIIFSR